MEGLGFRVWLRVEGLGFWPQRNIIVGDMSKMSSRTTLDPKP